MIKVTRMLDFETGGAPAFLVNVWNVDRDLAGIVSVRVTITDINEAPKVDAIPAGDVPWVYENFQVGDAVVTKVASQASPDAASDPDTKIVASDPEGLTLTYTVENDVPFTIDSDGILRVSGTLEADDAAAGTHKTHDVMVSVSDPGDNSTTVTVTVTVLNSNETPRFTAPSGDAAVTTIPENTGNADVIFTFTAVDEDGDDLAFTLREGQSRDLFVIENEKSEIVGDDEVWSGELHVKTGVTLDFEDPGYDPRVHVEANDPEGLNATLLLTVNLENLNDEMPMFDGNPLGQISVAENTARDTMLGNSYAASDPDGFPITYSLTGDDEKSFSISTSGALMTLESLDYDSDASCNTCNFTVVASDGVDEVTMEVTVTVTNVEDSVGTVSVTKANPVPGTEMGNAMSALAGNKTGGDEYLWNLLDCAGMLDLVGSTRNEATYCKMWDGLSTTAKRNVSAAFRALGVEAPAENPYDLPASLMAARR